MTDNIMRCDLQDYIEIACLFHYQVEITLRDGSLVRGEASTTRIDSALGEVLMLRIDGSDQALALSQFMQMRVLTPGARFTAVSFID